MAMATNMAMAMAARPKRRINAMSRAQARLKKVQDRRSIRQWALRGASVLMIGALGVLGAVHSLAYRMRQDSPAFAHVLTPWDGRITAKLAEQLSTLAATPAERAESDRLAIDALAADPMAVSALATLGSNADVRGDTAKARRIFAYSERLSRRDLPTHLWAIEDAVKRNDIAGALRHYDFAMRTSSSASSILYPILGKAIDSADVRQQLTLVLKRQPAWAEGMLAYVASTGNDSGSLMALFSRLQRDRVPISAYINALVVQRLIALGAVQEAWQYYSQISPGSDRSQLRDPGFRKVLDHPTPFDWSVVTDNPGATASLQANGNSGLLDFSASTMAGGEVVHQMQLLPPGKYILEGVSENIAMPSGTHPYWSLVCTGGQELGRVEIPDSATNNGRFIGSFTVPSACASQSLKLIIRPTSDASSVAGQIGSVSLHPAK